MLYFTDKTEYAYVQCGVELDICKLIDITCGYMARLGLEWSIEFEDTNRSDSSDFLPFRIVSLHNKSNGTKLLSTEADCKNCATSFLAA